MAQSVMNLLHKHEGLSLIPAHMETAWCGMDLKTQVMELGKLLVSVTRMVILNYKLQAPVRIPISKNKADSSRRMTLRADLWLPHVILLPTYMPSSTHELTPLHS